jgi:DnaJ-class molecular chaperone
MAATTKAERSSASGNALRYAVLELGHDATADEIRAAYRRPAKQFHPDGSDATDAHQRFIAPTEAYEILSVPIAAVL